MRGKDMKRTRAYITKILSILLALSLAVSVWGVAGTEALAVSPNKYGTYVGPKPGKYNFTGSTLHILPQKVFYSSKNGKLYYYAYVYNNTEKTIYGLKDLKITVKTSSNKKIATQTFYKNKRQNMTINPGSYKKICFIFEKKNITNKKYNFGTANKLKTQATFTYYT